VDHLKERAEILGGGDFQLAKTGDFEMAIDSKDPEYGRQHPPTYRGTIQALCGAHIFSCQAT
jgi:hypothetical protein